MPATYPAATPHGPITPVTDGIYYVRGTFRMGPGLVISRTMTIVTTAEGVVLIEAIRLDAAGERALAELGRVAHVVTLSDAHGADDAYYVATFGAARWTMPSGRSRGLAPGRVLGEETPIPGAKLIVIPDGRAARSGGAIGCEGALLLPHGGGTLITCDAIQNHADKVGASFVARVMTPLLGFKGGVIVPKMWRKVREVKASAIAATFEGLTSLTFANLITGHGPPVIGGADQTVRAAIAKVAQPA